MDEEYCVIPPSERISYEEHVKVPIGDIPTIRTLFENAFPLSYGDQFYRGLNNGNHQGKPLVSFVARKEEEGNVVGVACASLEKEGEANEGKVAMTGDTMYLMTLAVDPK